VKEDGTKKMGRGRVEELKVVESGTERGEQRKDRGV